MTKATGRTPRGRAGIRAAGAAPAFVVGLVLMLASANDARAYIQTVTMDGWPTAWHKRHISLQFYSENPPPFLEQASMVNMIRASAAAWSTPAVACTELVLDVVENATGNVTAEYDNVYRIGFRRDEWARMPCSAVPSKTCDHPSNAIAVTTVVSNRRTGEILDADIEINAVNQRFSDVVVTGPRPPGATMSVQDLQNTITHELGHLIGLDHNCYDPLTHATVPRDETGANAPACANATPAMAESTMFNSALPGETKKRDLAADDLKAVCEIYAPGSGADLDGGGAWP